MKILCVEDGVESLAEARGAVARSRVFVGGLRHARTPPGKERPQ